MAKSKQPQQNKPQPDDTELPLPVVDDAERTVLGEILMVADAYYQAAAVNLHPEDFHIFSNRTIFRRVGEMCDKKIPLDLVSLSNYLHTVNELEIVGGVAYLSTLIDNAPGNQKAFENHIQLLKDAAMRRKFYHICHNGCQQAVSLADPIKWSISGTNDDLLKLQGDAIQQRGQFIHEFSGNVIDQLKSQMYLEREIIGLPFGVPELDEMTTGIREKEVVVVGGFPGSGKTSEMLTIARVNAKAQTPVVFFSVEMDKETLLMRLVAQESDISYAKLRNPKNLLTQEFKEINSKWLPDMATWPLLIDDQARTLDEIIARAHLYKRKHNMKLMLVDYLQIVDARFEKEYDRVSAASDAFMYFAKETGVPVVIGSQLTRPEKKERGVNVEPNMMMLRSSGKIEQNAHVIIFTHHPEDSNGDPTGEDLLIIGKQRAGRKGRVRAYFDTRIQRWEARGATQPTEPQQQSLV